MPGAASASCAGTASTVTLKSILHKLEWATSPIDTWFVVLIVNPPAPLLISSGPLLEAWPSHTLGGAVNGGSNSPGPGTISAVLIWNTPVSTSEHVVPLTVTHDGISLMLVNIASSNASKPVE